MIFDLFFVLWDHFITQYLPSFAQYILPLRYPTPDGGTDWGDPLKGLTKITRQFRTRTQLFRIKIFHVSNTWGNTSRFVVVRPLLCTAARIPALLGVALVSTLLIEASGGAFG